jgi:DNA uptake protein ComE-like DNA-binding protein
MRALFKVQEAGTPRGGRGFATLLVFGIIILCAVLLGIIQSTAFSQAAAGREAVGRVRAYWAARAGVEETIARLEFSTLNQADLGAVELMNELADAASGQMGGEAGSPLVRWKIAHWEGKKEVPGPRDAHSLLNINSSNTDALLNITPFMSEAVVDSIKDWVDADEDVNLQGAEIGYYQSLEFGYVPRNDAMRSFTELELVADVEQRDVRGEDWNLNGVLDPNEDDGSLTWPPDNSDGVLDGAWSSVLTAASIDGGLTPSGQAPLDLQVATAPEVVTRTQVTSEQAEVLVSFAQQVQNASMRTILRRTMTQLKQSVDQAAGTVTQGGQQPTITALTDEELAMVMDECVIGAPEPNVYYPGKLNVNTCDAQVLEYLPNMTPELADAILAERAGSSEGFKSIVDLLKVPNMTKAQLSPLYDFLCVRSNVFQVTSRGTDERTGIEVEIQVDLNRSTLPVTLSGTLVR